MPKRIVLMILVCLLVVSVFQAPMFQAYAEEESKNIIINGVDIGYADGDYFTKNGESCYNEEFEDFHCHQQGICDASGEGCNCMRYWPSGYPEDCKVDLLSTQCMGFARYCQWAVYGYHEAQKPKKFFRFAFNLTAEDCDPISMQNTFLNCAPATHIRIGNDAHSICVVSTDYDGIVIAEGNYDSYCGIREIRYSWKAFSEYLQRWGGITYAVSVRSVTPFTEDHELPEHIMESPGMIYLISTETQTLGEPIERNDPKVEDKEEQETIDDENPLEADMTETKFEEDIEPETPRVYLNEPVQKNAD